MGQYAGYSRKASDHIIPYAHENSQIPTRPSWVCVKGTGQFHTGHIVCKNSFADIFPLTLVPLAIRAALVAFELE